MTMADSYSGLLDILAEYCQKWQDPSEFVKTNVMYAFLSRCPQNYSFESTIECTE